MLYFSAQYAVDYIIFLITQTPNFIWRKYRYKNYFAYYATKRIQYIGFRQQKLNFGEVLMLWLR